MIVYFNYVTKCKRSQGSKLPYDLYMWGMYPGSSFTYIRHKSYFVSKIGYITFSSR